MRHKIAHKKLSRKSSHRSSMLINLASSLIEHEQIQTTLPKAKSLRPFLEKLVTKAKKSKTDNQREVKRLLLSRLHNNINAVKKLLDTLGPRYKTRPGGYLRILKSGFRKGDNAPMSYIQFVEKKELQPKLEKNEK